MDLVKKSRDEDEAATKAPVCLRAVATNVANDIELFGVRYIPFEEL